MTVKRLLLRWTKLVASWWMTIRMSQWLNTWLLTVIWPSKRSISASHVIMLHYKCKRKPALAARSLELLRRPLWPTDAWLRKFNSISNKAVIALDLQQLKGLLEKLDFKLLAWRKEIISGCHWGLSAFLTPLNQRPSSFKMRLMDFKELFDWSSF